MPTPSTAIANRAPAGEMGATASSVELVRIADSWARRPSGYQYVKALQAWLAGLRSPHTRRSYAFAIAEFFGWYEITHGRIPMPNEVSRAQAFQFTDYLRERTTGLGEQRLEKMTDKRAEVEAYRFVRRHAGAHFAEIRQHLLSFPTLTKYVDGKTVLAGEEEDPDWLDRFLACMVERKQLRREPTIEDIRTGRVKVDVGGDPSRAQIDFRVDPRVFSYSVDPHVSGDAASRASTIKVRLAALQSFWTHLIEGGENVAGGDPLLRFNIWSKPKRTTATEARAHAKATRALKRPSLEIYRRLLGTTYKPLASGELVRSPTFEDSRDRALLVFMFHVGVRADEVGHLRRSDITWHDGYALVSVLGKGNKRRTLRLPQEAYDELLDLTRRLEQLAVGAERQSSGTIPRARRLLDPAAPLFPKVKMWGCNAQYEDGGVSPKGVAKMLSRRALEAGIAPDSPDFARVHPHGIRHLAAHTALEAGTPLPVIQGVLGHSSIATTGDYTEIHDPRDLALFGWSPSQPRGAAPAREAPPAAPVAGVAPIAAPAPARAPERRPAPAHVPTIVEAVGVPVPERPAAPRPVGPVPTAVAGPAVPERMVAVGEPGLALPAEEAETVATLDEVYAKDWGEKGKGERLRTGAKRMEDEAYDNLSRTIAGRTTGLVWWQGTTGKLPEAMPVMSGRQMLGEESPYGNVRDGLADLWTRWMDLREGDRGPTAASALVLWLRKGLEITYDVEGEVEARGGRWVPYVAPLSATKLPPDGQRTAFREHRDDQVVRWYHDVAWQYRQSRGRTETGGRAPRVVDTVLEVPHWYKLRDPLDELLDLERIELFDWLRVLTGRPPIDTTLRYAGVSRKQVGEIIGLFCTYDADRSELRRAQKMGERDRVGDLKEAVESDRQAVNLMVQALTKKPFDIKKEVDARVAERRQRAASTSAEEEEPRESNRHFYRKVVGQLFGQDAADDDILWIFSSCKLDDAPLSGGDYPQLFNIKGKTIEHTAEFAKRFANETGGANSECVARRMARELWELRKARARQAMTRFDELVELVNAMAAYRVPCPEIMERETRERMADVSPVPVFEEWQRWRDRIESAFGPEREAERAQRRREAERREAILEEFAAPAEEYRSAIGVEARQRDFEPNARARELSYTPNVRRLVPNPVDRLIAVFMR